MAKTLSTEENATISHQRHISDIHIGVSEGGTAYAEAVFLIYSILGDGTIINKKHHKTIRIDQSKLIELLPTDLLPSFSDMYTGLSSLFHDYLDELETPPEPEEEPEV